MLAQACESLRWRNDSGGEAAHLPSRFSRRPLGPRGDHEPSGKPAARQRTGGGPRRPRSGRQQSRANRFEPRSDARRKKHQRFAKDIARRWDKGLAANEFDSLLLFASEPFLGELRAQLGEAVERHLKLPFSNDLTSLRLAEIEARLQAAWVANR